MKFYLIIISLICSSSISLGQDNSTEPLLIISNQNKDTLKPIPYLTLKYLDDNYSDYQIIDSKMEDNGDNQISIKCDTKTTRPYYRNLLFNSYGQLIQYN